MPADPRAYNRQLIADFRSKGAPEGRPLLLLTTTGAKSGELRTTPLMYARVGDRLLVIASNNGAQRDPDWFRNLRAEPAVRVEIGAEDYPARAVVAVESDRDDLFAAIVAQYPFFADHQSKIERTIPVVELVPNSHPK
jgi:F420H(2)-dependent quinone reductase